MCTRIDQILSGQGTFLPESTSVEIETEAQRYAARLVVLSAPATSDSESSEVEYHEVDLASLELVRPRSVGVEHVGLAALDWLEMPQILEAVGFNKVQRAAALGSIVGRMAVPGSELSTQRWLTERSALGELLEVDFEAMPLMRFYRVSDVLVRHRQVV